MTQAEPTPVQRFAGNLRRVREESGLSQAEVADRSGMHASTISAMERALHTPRLDSILRLSSALDTLGLSSRRDLVRFFSNMPEKK